VGGSGHISRVWHAIYRSSTGLRFFDEMPQAELRLAYSAADALILASERKDGLMFCSRRGMRHPSVAFPVGGVPEILNDLALGIMVRGAHDAEASPTR